MNSKLWASCLMAMGAALAAGCGGDGDATTDTANPADTQVVGDTASPTTPSDTATSGDTKAPPDCSGCADTADADGITLGGPACQYTFDDATSYVTQLAIGGVTSEGGAVTDDCCWDYDGDDEIDNRVGELIQIIATLPVITADVNQIIADNIADGTYTVLLEYVGLEDVMNDEDVEFNLFYGQDTDDDWVNNIGGSGTFTVDADSFHPGTATPLVHFDGVTITDQILSAGPATFRLEVPLLGGLEIVADVKQARIEGTVADAPNGGVILTGHGGRGAKLGGIIHQDQLFAAFNSFVDSRCSCIDTGVADGGGRRDVLEDRGAGDWRCNIGADTSACDKDHLIEKNCITLVDVCPAALVLISPDLDTDDDGEEDSFSIGVWVAATGAGIVGVEPEVCGE